MRIINSHIKAFVSTMKMNPPAIAETLRDVEFELGIKFPEQYKNFMLESNGAEGCIGKNAYLVIWPIEEIVKRNRGYMVDEFVPGLVYFGSNGGGAAYAFDKRDKTIPIVKFPFDSINIADAKQLGSTFEEFLESIYNT